MAFLANAVNYSLICINTNEMVYGQTSEIDVFASVARLPLFGGWKPQRNTGSITTQFTYF